MRIQHILSGTKSPHLFHSRMDKEGEKPKTFVSTFRLVLKPKDSSFFVGRPKNYVLDTKNGNLAGSSKVEVSPSTGKES